MGLGACGVGQGVLALRVPATLPLPYILPPRTFHALTHTCAICLFSVLSWHPLQEKQTPLHLAILKGLTELAVKLVELGADVNAVNKVGPLGGVQGWVVYFQWACMCVCGPGCVPGV